MAGLRHVCQLLVLLDYLPALVLVLAQNPVEDKTTFEAAFQGKPVSVYGLDSRMLCDASIRLHDFIAKGNSCARY